MARSPWIVEADDEGMWTPCPQTLDEPVKVFGLEPEDFAVMLAVPAAASLAIDVLLSCGCGVLVGLVMYFGKRGRPPGALLHMLHDYGIVQLPGILPATEQTYSPW